MADADLTLNLEAVIDARFLQIFSGRKDIKKIALDSSAAVILRLNKERFLKAQDPNGQKWPVSRAAIFRSDSGKKTLFDTGSLFRAIQVFRARANTNTRTVGVNPALRNSRSGARIFDYANKLDRGEGPFPARRILGITNDDARRVNLVVGRVIEKELNR